MLTPWEVPRRSRRATVSRESTSWITQTRVSDFIRLKGTASLTHWRCGTMLWVVSRITAYRWWAEYGGLRVDQARRLKQLEAENSRRKRTVAELTLDNQILKEAAEGNF